MGLKINIKIDDYKLKFWKVGNFYFSLSFLTSVIGKQIGPTKDSIGTLFEPPMFLDDQAKLLIFQCFEANISQAFLLNLFKIKSHMDGSACFEKLGSQDSRVLLHPNSWFQENQENGN